MISNILKDQINKIGPVEIETKTGTDKLSNYIYKSNSSKEFKVKQKRTIELIKGKEYIIEFNMNNYKIPLTVMRVVVKEELLDQLEIEAAGYYNQDIRYCNRTGSELTTINEIKMKLSEESLEAFNMSQEQIDSMDEADIYNFYNSIQYRGKIYKEDIEKVRYA